MSGVSTVIRDWTIRLHVTDFGQWLPDDEQAAAELIWVINTERRPQDGKPRVEVWGGERTLVASIDAESFSVAPGEHLVRTILPDGSEQWGGMEAELLTKLATELTR